jgi:hypothetical protein
MTIKLYIYILIYYFQDRNNILIIENMINNYAPP